MISDSVINKFNYKIFQPYAEVIHSVGLLHSSMQTDASFAFKQVSEKLKNNFAVAMVYDTKKKGGDVIALKLYKSGVKNLSDSVKSKLSINDFPYDSSSLSNKVLFDPKRKSRKSIYSGFIIGSMLTGVKYILVIDLTTKKHFLVVKSYYRNRDTD